MARTSITVTSLSGPYAGSVDSVTFEDADTSNKNDFTHTGQEIILVRNDSGSDQTFTITSVDDDLGRSEDIASETITGDNRGSVKAYEASGREGWTQTDGTLHFEASTTDVEFAVLRTSELT